MQRETKAVLAELMEKLRGKLEPKATSSPPAEAGPRGELSPNLDRLTVGLDLGDQWNHFCILGLQGETLSEGQLRTNEEVAEFFQHLPPASRWKFSSIHKALNLTVSEVIWHHGGGISVEHCPTTAKSCWSQWWLKVGVAGDRLYSNYPNYGIYAQFSDSSP